MRNYLLGAPVHSSLISQAMPSFPSLPSWCCIFVPLPWCRTRLLVCGSGGFQLASPSRCSAPCLLEVKVHILFPPPHCQATLFIIFLPFLAHWLVLGLAEFWKRYNLRKWVFGPFFWPVLYLNHRKCWFFFFLCSCKYRQSGLFQHLYLSQFWKLICNCI